MMRLYVNPGIMANTQIRGVKHDKPSRASRSEPMADKHREGMDFGPEYASLGDRAFVPRYRASCHCGAVRYEVRADPVDAKLCHCHDCQRLHGAPMQWAAIFYKRDVRFTSGIERLRYYNSRLRRAERILPCKVACDACGTPVGDEGRNMWLAFPTLFDFGRPQAVPPGFRPTCHIFYGLRVIDVADELPKWTGHKNASTHL